MCSRNLPAAQLCPDISAILLSQYTYSRLLQHLLRPAAILKYHHCHRKDNFFQYFPCHSMKNIWAVTWDFQQCGMCDQQSLRSACAYAQSDQSLCLSLEYSMTVKLLTEHHLEFLSLTGGCTGSSESTLVKMSNCWKSHAKAQTLLP